MSERRTNFIRSMARHDFVSQKGLLVFVRKLDSWSELCSNEVKKLVSITTVKRDWLSPVYTGDIYTFCLLLNSCWTYSTTVAASSGLKKEGLRASRLSVPQTPWKMSGNPLVGRRSQLSIELIIAGSPLTSSSLLQKSLDGSSINFWWLRQLANSLVMQWLLYRLPLLGSEKKDLERKVGARFNKAKVAVQMLIDTFYLKVELIESQPWGLIHNAHLRKFLSFSQILDIK